VPPRGATKEYHKQRESRDVRGYVICKESNAGLLQFIPSNHPAKEVPPWGATTEYHKQRESRDVRGYSSVRSLMQVCSSAFHAITQLRRCHRGALQQNIINKENQEM
jgi:hypothetical protein